MKGFYWSGWDGWRDICQCDGPKPTALPRVHGTPTEELSGADRAWYDDRLRQSPTVLLLRTSFPPTVIGLKSTQVIASNPAPADGRAFYGWIPGRPLSWHFLLWRVRVSCHLWTNGIPGGGDPGGLDAVAKPKAAGEAKGAVGEARIHHHCGEEKGAAGVDFGVCRRWTPFVMLFGS